jgi:anti-sigma factor RsiW
MTKPIQPNARPPHVDGCSQMWSEKLFWYVNETLEVDEASQVETHMEDCTECRSEVAELRLLQEAVRERASQAPEPSEAVFERVMEQIEAYEAKRFRPGRLLKRLTSWIPSAELLWQPALRPAAAVAALVIMVQAVAIVGLLSLGGPSPGPSYRTLAGKPAVEAAGPMAKIAFHGGATEQNIRSLLGEADASIVSGPSALGFYTVALPADLSEEAAINEAISHLRARQDIVRFVERLP